MGVGSAMLLPTLEIQAVNPGEMVISAGEGQVMLHCGSGDPDIVFGYWFAFDREASFDGGV